MRKNGWAKHAGRLGIFAVTALLACAAPSWSGEEMAEPEKIPPPVAASDAYNEGDPFFYEELPDSTAKNGQSIGIVEWSVDQGRSWHPGNGENGEQIPAVSEGIGTMFQIQKKDPHLPWPDEPIFYPAGFVTWTGDPNIDKGFIGDQYNSDFPATPKGVIAGTFTVDCGNRITLVVFQTIDEPDIVIVDEDGNEIPQED